MLIKALCDYFDIASEAGLLTPDGYSETKTHFKIALNENGEICEVINVQNQEQRGSKTVFVPRIEIFPKRAEVSAVFANYIEHRPLYLFGLSVSKVVETENGEKENILEITPKSEKSFKYMVEKNLSFLEDIDSPIVNAFRKFITNWNPENELENSFLKSLIGFDKSGYTFCLDGNPEYTLHKDEKVLEKWEELYFQETEDETAVYEQCSITGNVEKIARTHGKIKGIHGGASAGNVLVCFNNSCDESYGRTQSYNCNISEKAMKKYTTALNYLLSSDRHNMAYEDLNIVFWAMNERDENENLLMNSVFGNPNSADREKTEEMLLSLLKDAQKGDLTPEMLNAIDNIDGNVDFYMVGMTPNVSRIAINFVHKNKFVDVMKNVVKYQQEMQVSDEIKPVYIWHIKDALQIQRDKKNSSDNKKIHTSLMAKIFEAVLFGTHYPNFLLADIVRRVKVETQANSYINRIRAGIIKACINRNYHKGVKNMLDTKNTDVAYVCGRLFAVLEKIQKDSVHTSLNRTIKDTYFASAATRPASIFPKLLTLSNSHMRKIKSENPAWATRNEKLLVEIEGLLDSKYPTRLSLVDQGTFYIGYYHQYQDFFKKNENKNTVVTENNKEEDI